MATIKRPVITAEPASLTGSRKQTTITTLTSKKLLKPDAVIKKSPILATKTTSLTHKVPPKQVSSKMASTKVTAATVDISAAISLKTSPPKPNAAVTSTLKPVIAKTPVKRVVADSTSSDKEPAAKPVRKLSIPTGLTKLTTKVSTKPVASSDSKIKATLTLDNKVATTKTKTAISTGKMLAKPAAEVKLPAKAKLTSSTLPSKTSLANATKPLITNAMAKRPLAPTKVDIKKPIGPKLAPTKSVSKTAVSVVKPPFIRTPITPKKVIRKCMEVEICDADSTSPTMSDQMDMELGLDFSTAIPRETTPVEFNEQQAYKVAEQMMEVLGTALVTNEAIQQVPLLKDSVVIDMCALEIGSQSVPTLVDLASVSVEAHVLEQTTSPDCEQVEQKDVCNDLPNDAAMEGFCVDLIAFSDNAEISREEEPPKEEAPAKATVEAGAANETIVEDGVLEEATVESSDDQDEDIEPSVENKVSGLTDEEVPADDSAVVVDEVNEPSMEEINSDEQTIVTDDGEFNELAAEEKVTSDINILENQDETATQDDDMAEESSVMSDENPQEDSQSAEPEDCLIEGKDGVIQNGEEFVDDVEMSDNPCEITSENEAEEEKVLDYDNCSTEAEVEDENVETEEGSEVNEMPLITDAQTALENIEDAENAADESQPERPEEISPSEEVTDPANIIDIQEDHFGANTIVSASVNSEDQCYSDDFVVIKLDDENGDEDPELLPLIVYDFLAVNAEKSADSESIGSADSAASYADVVKQTAVEYASDFEAIEKEEALDDLHVGEDKETDEDMVRDADNLPTVTVISEVATGDAGATKAAGDATADLVGEQVVKVEPLLGSMTDEVQLELDAGMEHSHAVDEEGYEKVQKKRNKRQNKRSRKSLKALKKENVDCEPATEVQESHGDDCLAFQKRKNYRRTKNSMKKQYRRYSEPLVKSPCYVVPVWKSIYAEN